MNQAARRVLIFGLQFLIAFGFFFWLYLEWLPSYQRIVLGLANQLLEFSGLGVGLDPEGGWQMFTRTDDGDLIRFKGVRPSSLHLFYVNLALLPALVVATPAHWLARLRLLALALALLFVIHVLSVVGLVEAHYRVELNPVDLPFRWLNGILKVSGQIFAVLLWALLTWSYWLPGRAQTRS